jgi:lipoprotein-releasing system permease protein
LSLAWEIALRYFRKRSSRLVSRVSLLAVGGVALGVAALVVAMGLLAGYREEIQGKLIGANAQVVVFPLTGEGIENPANLARRLEADPRIVAVSAALYAQGMASTEGVPDGVNVIIKGIDRASEARVTSIGSALLSAVAAGGSPPGCAIGAELARRLGLAEGGLLVLSVPDASRRGRGFGLRRREFRVGKIFRTNFFEYDSEWIFLPLEQARLLTGLRSAANVLEIKLDSLDHTAAATAAIRRILGDGFTATDWRSLNSSLFSALTLQRITLFLVIGLIVAVSTFNIVATLVMSVQEKKRDIGALSALGAPPGMFPRVFLRLGILLGGAGVIFGLLFGSIACAVITRFRLISFPPEVAQIYFVSFVPFLVRGRDLLLIALFSMAAVVLAAISPARRAARLDIAEALRYE